ncbi:hypothetical protein NBRC116493_10120 [Aurantivibrio infirmus]
MFYQNPTMTNKQTETQFCAYLLSCSHTPSFLSGFDQGFDISQQRVVNGLIVEPKNEDKIT